MLAVVHGHPQVPHMQEGGNCDSIMQYMMVSQALPPGVSSAPASRVHQLSVTTGVDLTAGTLLRSRSGVDRYTSGCYVSTPLQTMLGQCWGQLCPAL